MSTTSSINSSLTTVISLPQRLDHYVIQDLDCHFNPCSYFITLSTKDSRPIQYWEKLFEVFLQSFSGTCLGTIEMWSTQHRSSLKYVDSFFHPHLHILLNSTVDARLLQLNIKQLDSNLNVHIKDADYLPNRLKYLSKYHDSLFLLRRASISDATPNHQIKDNHDRLTRQKHKRGYSFSSFLRPLILSAILLFSYPTNGELQSVPSYRLQIHQWRLGYYSGRSPPSFYDLLSSLSCDFTAFKLAIW